MTHLDPPCVPDRPDPEAIRTDMQQVLDGPSTFQAGAASILRLLRRYLEAVEEMDLAAGVARPRVRLFTHHRTFSDGGGLQRCPDGRIQVRIQELQEVDLMTRFVRLPTPGAPVIDLGIPELLMVAEGFSSDDAQRLGFEQHDVSIDHGDGRGPVVGQADFVAGLVEVLVDGRLRRRISSCFDDDNREYWLRQIAVGHENDPAIGWVLVQVPDFLDFDPIAQGLVPQGTRRDSAEYFGAYQRLLFDFYIGQAADVLDVPVAELRKVQMTYGPKLFSLIERVGDDAQVAANGVVAGDSFGNGHFLTSGGAMTGMIGHSARVLQYWRSRSLGADAGKALRALADGIREDTLNWLEASEKEYRTAAPVNFGKERIALIAERSGIDADRVPAQIDAARRMRHSLLPLDASDWRRRVLRNGIASSTPLPALQEQNPENRTDVDSTANTWRAI
ncbi:hypothetical protein [Micromonospora sp. NPDC049102]|uniref:hypothetical protein n=1 Tax=Micromonospora sp. NPDC049102 TaxID=3364265 RepID=UPI003715F011